MEIKEEFLYNIWQFKRWGSSIKLKTTQGEEIEVLSPGVLNPNAGPDFLNARLRIGGVLWAGNVEIHLRTTDWFLHRHEEDPAYQKIILHVVFQDNSAQKVGDFSTLELGNYVSKELILSYKNLNRPFDFIPCESSLPSVEAEVLETTKINMLLEKWMEKEQILQQRLDQLAGDWEQLLFEQIAYVFGLRINGEAFLQLARSLKNNQLNGLNLFQKEALIFGQAGFLQEFENEYTEALKKEYEFLQYKWNLTPLNKEIFKFFRLRPPNFPSVRMAQWAAFSDLFPQIFLSLKKNNFYEEFIEECSEIQASDFWNTHFTLGKPSLKNQPKKLSRSFIELLLINAFFPVHFLYLKSIDKNPEPLLNQLEKLPPEYNQIIKEFKALEIPISSALDTQGLLFLEKNYCQKKKCLNCKIGNHILRNHAK